MATFWAGALAARLSARRSRNVEFRETKTTAEMFGQLGWRFLIGGAISYFILLPFTATVPSMTAIVSALATLLIVVGTFSGALARLPKAGPWMGWVKRLFALLMIGAAEYYFVTMGQGLL